MTWLVSSNRQSFTGNPGWLVSAYAGGGIRGADVPSTGTNGPSIFFNDVTLPAENNDEFAWRIVSGPSNGGTFIPYEDGSFYFLGPAGTAVYEGLKNYVPYGQTTINLISATPFSGAAAIEDLGASGSFVVSAAGPVTFTGSAPLEDVGASGSFVVASPAVSFSGGAPIDDLGASGSFVSAVITNTVARPSLTLSNNGWLPSAGISLPAMVNEATPDDSNFISASGVGKTCKMELTATSFPGASVQAFRYRAQSVLGTRGAVFSLKQGATSIASWTHATLPTTMTTFEQFLSPAQVALLAAGPITLDITTI